MGMKRLHLREPNAKKLEVDFEENNPLLEKVLLAKGLDTGQKLTNFLSPDETLEDPFALKDMDKAVARLSTAVENGEYICVYGDYDVDGVTSVAILSSYLRDVGAHYRVVIPTRDDGYGMNSSIIEKLADDGVQLIITVDNGIVAVDETDFAKRLGIDVIITDHHQPRETLPNAVAVIDPHRKDCPSTFKEISGAGVVVKLLAAMEYGDYDMVLENYGDLLCVSTIGDVMPLVGENRIFVKRGLASLETTDNFGLRTLLRDTLDSGKKIDATLIAFSVVPKLNAAGRMNRAEDALSLLIAEDETKAEQLAEKLCSYNNGRKSLEKQIMADIEKKLLQNEKLLYDNVLILADKDWNQGILGICAAKMVEKTGKPCFLLQIREGKAVGSGRGVSGVSLAGLLTTCDDILLRYGGHDAAAGLTLLTSQVDVLRKRLNHTISSQYETMPVAEATADAEVSVSELTIENVRSLALLEPFGEANKNPLFLIRKFVIERSQSLGDGSHTKLHGTAGGRRCEVLCFGVPKQALEYGAGECVDIVVSADINVFRGNESVSLKLSHMELSGRNADIFFKSWFLYDKLMRGEVLEKSEIVFLTPERAEVAKIYIYLKERAIYQQGIASLSERMGSNYGKTKLILMILNELKLIQIENSAPYPRISVAKGAKKVDLTTSRLLARLYELGGETNEKE